MRWYPFWQGCCIASVIGVIGASSVLAQTSSASSAVTEHDEATDEAHAGQDPDAISLPTIVLTAPEVPKKPALAPTLGGVPETRQLSGPPLEGGDYPTDGYGARRAASGLKFDAELKDIPQTVVVVPRQVLEDAGGRDVGAALDSVPSVSRGNAFGGLNLYEFNFRGMPTRKWSKNSIAAGRQYDSAADTSNVERVEVMFGSANTLYGRSDPGGFYNIITKQPLDEHFFSVAGMVGAFDFRRATADANFSLIDDKSVLARFNMAVESGGSFRDYVFSDRLFFAPVVLWTPNSRTRITAEGEFIDEQRTFDRGGVAVGNSPDFANASRFFGEPNDGRFGIENASGALRIEHDISQDLTVRLAVNARTGSLYGWTAEPTAILADGRTLTRTHQLRDYDWRSLTTQFEAVTRFSFAGIHHNFLVGVEAEHYRGQEILNRSDPIISPYSVDIYNPVYGQGKPMITRFSDKLDSTDTYSVYFSDLIDITQRFKTLVGLRFDYHDQIMTQMTTGEALAQEPTALTPRIGFTYEIHPGLTMFANYSESFRPNLDADTGFVAGTGGSVFEPERGTSYEAGVKLDLLDGKFNITSAIFDIIKENVLTADPNNPGFSVAAGEVRSQGFDLNFSGHLSRELSVFGGYSYVDARVTEDPIIPVGSLVANVPKHSFKMRTVYEFREGYLRGVGVGGGITLMGERAGASTGPGFMLPRYTKIDALAYYKFSNDAKIALNIDNILDEEYVESAFGPLRLNYGAPASALLTLNARF